MFIVRLMGGLGNQLFQYSLALLLQQAGKEVVLEKTAFRKDRYKREYSLAMLPGRLPVMDDKTAKLLTHKKLLSRLYRLAARTAVRAYREGDSSGWQEALALAPAFHYHIVGYWQAAEMVEAEKHLLGDLRALRETIAIPAELKPATAAIHARQMWEHNALGEKSADHTGGGTIWLSADYYQRAIAAVKEKIPNPVFAVFGDNEQWCRENIMPLTTAGSVLVTPGQRPDWHDMLLMSRHRAVICANSTFSWWSGMLCDGEVIAPEQWSKNQEQFAKIYPRRWMRV